MNKSTAISYIDLLTCLFIFFAVAYAILSNAEIEKRKGNMEAKAEYVVILDWPDASMNDVDLWARDPEGNIVSFRTKDGGAMTLDRDDLGNNGALDPIRREIITIRSSLPGEYTINVMMFSFRSVPENVRISVMKMNPFSTIAERTILLSEPSQEVTAVTFTVDSNGRVLNVDTQSQTKLGLQ